MAAKSKLTMAINRARQIAGMFPGYFGQGDSKRVDAWQDYGFPNCPTFHNYWMQYRRNGIARAGVQRIIDKCWQDNPWLLEKEEPHDETGEEKRFRQWAERLQLWQKLREADEKSRVGEYAGVILRIADNKRPREPVEGVVTLDSIVDVLPVWQGQLRVSDWETDERSPEYGNALMYDFNELAVQDSEESHRLARSYQVHPDRVLVWSKDGTVFGESALEAGLNDLITLQKILGAGGEGFWKNARSAPHMDISAEANIERLAQSMGIKVEDVKEELGDMVEEWNSGFDNALTTQGIDVSLLSVQLPDPEQFVAGPLQSFCASVNTPQKILVGNQNGERASTEDANEFNQTAMSRRSGYVVPNVQRFLRMLINYGAIRDIDWYLDWSDLTEATMEKKIERAEKMSTINRNLMGTGQIAFTGDEIRESVGMEARTDLDALDPDDPEAEAEPTTNRRAKRLTVNIHKGGTRGRT